MRKNDDDYGFYNAINAHEYEKRRRSASKQKQKTHKERHKRIATSECRGYPSGYYLKEYRGSWKNEVKTPFVIRGGTPRIASYLKRRSNKIVRNTELEEIPSRCGYKKLYDYWWLLT